MECFQYVPWVQSVLWWQFRTASPGLLFDDGTKISFTETSGRNAMCKQKATLLNGWLYEWDELKNTHKAKHLCSVIGTLTNTVTHRNTCNLGHHRDCCAFGNQSSHKLWIIHLPSFVYFYNSFDSWWPYWPKHVANYGKNRIVFNDKIIYFSLDYLGINFSP